MCGVIGLIYDEPRDDLGRIATELLKTLEYRGYDSTGAAIQSAEDKVTLRKGVGAPSVMAKKLGIDVMSGRILCGQVRWATFGAVDDLNAQPHDVTCKIHLYGAHNGNVTNCDTLKQWLIDEGHAVRSDNDGEMVVHTIEHLFAHRIAQTDPAKRDDATTRRNVMRQAITAAAAARLEGSFAAVIVDPPTRTLWAIKHGSSLYAGIGTDERGVRFRIASSDLSSVLKLTRVVVPIVQGEFVEFSDAGYAVYGHEDGPDGPIPVALPREPRRSRLQAADISLLPSFDYFMDQEIAAQEDTVRGVVRMLHGGSASTRSLAPYLDTVPPEDAAAVVAYLDGLRSVFADDDIRARFIDLADSDAFGRLVARIPTELRGDNSGPVDLLAEKLTSQEAGLLADVLPMTRDTNDRFAVRLLDAIIERTDAREYATAVQGFVDAVLDAHRRGRRVLVACCGSSYNAALAGAVFFNEVACLELTPMLPGEFRGRYSRTIRDGDVVVAISQSGETKDLIDIMNDIIGSGRDVRRIGIINNINSTLAQEKTDVVIPLRCGPEIAVPATKSFMNQVAVLYGLALKVGEARCGDGSFDASARAAMGADVGARFDRLHTLPDLLRATFESTDAAVDEAAQLLYLRPSIHILATRINAIAKEGALKVREVVLNHTEGYEGSEFKHGPNTILGHNTVFGPPQVRALMARTAEVIDGLLAKAAANGKDGTSLRRLAQSVNDAVFHPDSGFGLAPDERALLHDNLDRPALLDVLYDDYPLIYITGPDPRDVALTVSQINTHKIRGASTVVVAEDSAALRLAAGKKPADNDGYRHIYIELPRTNDTLMSLFTATLVLQRLALKMSVAKAQYLNRLGFEGHGVHPDVPKNVSKSITVD